MKHTPEKNLTHIFGPVPSRRLGYSLGVDIIPMKTCSVNCIYCELGRTSKETLERRDYVPVDVIVDEIKEAILNTKRIDFISFSGSGEPTLNSEIGEMIARVKAMTEIPIAVLTNGALFYLPEVRSALRDADLVMPSLDAASQEVFRQINRPHGRLLIEDIISGLATFRREFSGQIWLEILFVRGVNDSAEEIEQLVRAVDEIKPDRVQLNTVARPPAEAEVQALSLEELQQLQSRFGEQAEVIASFHRTADQQSNNKDTGTAILAMAARRPVTIDDLSVSLGLHRDKILKYLSLLLKAGIITARRHEGKRFYAAAVEIEMKK